MRFVDLVITSRAKMTIIRLFGVRPNTVPALDFVSQRIDHVRAVTPAGEVATVSPILHTTACSQIRTAIGFYILCSRIARVTRVVSETTEVFDVRLPSGRAILSDALHFTPIDNSCWNVL